MTASEMIFQCPYCRRGDGDVAVNLTEAIAWEKAGHTTTVDLIELSSPPLVLFNPNSANPQACPHLISFSLNLR